MVAGWQKVGVDEVIVPDFTLGRGTQRLDRMDTIITEVAAVVPLIVAHIPPSRSRLLLASAIGLGAW